MTRNIVSIEFSTHWGDMDALGHVNHTRYLVWCETARLILFDKIGLDCNSESKAGPILATANARYLLPVMHPEQMRVKAWVSHIGETSFVVDYSISALSRPETPAATCQTVVVVYDYTAGTKTPISNEMRRLLKTFML